MKHRFSRLRNASLTHFANQGSHADAHERSRQAVCGGKVPGGQKVDHAFSLLVCVVWPGCAGRRMFHGRALGDPFRARQRCPFGGRLRRRRFRRRVERGRRHGRRWRRRVRGRLGRRSDGAPGRCGRLRRGRARRRVERGRRHGRRWRRRVRGRLGLRIRRRSRTLRTASTQAIQAIQATHGARSTPRPALATAGPRPTRAQIRQRSRTLRAASTQAIEATLGARSTRRCSQTQRATLRTRL